jgi:hypothetical protein
LPVARGGGAEIELLPVEAVKETDPFAFRVSRPRCV